ncbi:hypothetical protein BDV18DRAFT_133055 [Aspergillus unguis]
MLVLARLSSSKLRVALLSLYARSPLGRYAMLKDGIQAGLTDRYDGDIGRRAKQALSYLPEHSPRNFLIGIIMTPDRHLTNDVERRREYTKETAKYLVEAVEANADEGFQ